MGVSPPGTHFYTSPQLCIFWPFAGRLGISVQTGQKNHLYWRGGGGGGVGGEDSAWSRAVWVEGWRGSAGQEAPIHGQTGARDHGAPVTQQEEDGVHHVVHLCRRGGAGCG